MSNELKKLKDRLDVLEKENKELRKNVKEIENLYLKENKHWCETMDNLRKENENLKEKLNGIPPEYDGYLYFIQDISNIVKENEKLKKALDIFKKIVSIPLEDDFAKVKIDKVTKEETLYYALSIKYLIDEQEYELIKEVLDE